MTSSGWYLLTRNWSAGARCDLRPVDPSAVDDDVVPGLIEDHRTAAEFTAGWARTVDDLDQGSAGARGHFKLLLARIVGQSRSTGCRPGSLLRLLEHRHVGPRVEAFQFRPFLGELHLDP